MANPLVELSIAARFAANALRRRLTGQLEPAPDIESFESQMRAALTAAGPSVIRDQHWLTLPATQPPWLDTGVVVTPETDVSYFAAGRVYASRALDIWVAPKNQIWARLGEKGSVISSSRDSNSFTSREPSNLFLGNCFPNDWSDRQGSRLQDDSIYASVTGETRICIIEWAIPVDKGLTALFNAGDPQALVSREIERRGGLPGPPPDWKPLWNIGENEIFKEQAEADGKPSICCHVEGDVGILQKEVDIPLTEDSEVSWRWLIDALPGVTREDTLPSHDYLSIAVEFDNGWDITYYWSTQLAEETGYVCPLPNWKHREYHVVVRSGKQGLGAPHNERRNLHRDTQHYMQAHMDTPPTRIVRVWLIANSVFLRRPGRATFSDIRLSGGGREIEVL